MIWESQFRKKVTSIVFQFVKVKFAQLVNEPLNFPITFSATHLVITGVASTLYKSLFTILKSESSQASNVDIVAKMYEE